MLVLNCDESSNAFIDKGYCFILRYNIKILNTMRHNFDQTTKFFESLLSRCIETGM